jgi:hypothetical protein
MRSFMGARQIGRFLSAPGRCVRRHRLADLRSLGLLVRRSLDTGLFLFFLLQFTVDIRSRCGVLGTMRLGAGLVALSFKAVLNLAAVLSLWSTSALAANITLAHGVTTLHTPSSL